MSKQFSSSDVFAAQEAYKEKHGSKADTLHVTAPQLAALMAEVYPVEAEDAPKTADVIWGLSVVLSDRFSVTRGRKTVPASSRRGRGSTLVRPC